MSSVDIITSEGKKIALDRKVIDLLAGALRGELLQPGEEGFDAARTIWNAMIDRRPALIARCQGAADVMHAVEFAAEHGLLLSIRGGGHNIAGNAVCDGGLMIDLSAMNGVRIDPAARRAHVGPGATLGDLDHETQAFALATPTGINSTTGVAGLALGGGFGWLSRKYGFTVDNLVAADVVTADGKLVQASEHQNPDLFWALRGGSGNFGVVTRFEFELHPVGPEVFSGLIVFPFDQAKTVLAKYRDFAAEAPDDLTVWVVLRKAPPLPFLPAEVHGKEVVVLAVFHAGSAEEGEQAIAPLRSFGKAHGEHFGMQPFTAWQSAFDPLLTPGARNYWKSHNFAQIADGALDVVVDYAERLPSAECEIFIGQLGGQAGRVSPAATAYAHRDANFVLNVHGRWQDAADDDRCIGWARDLFQATRPHAMDGVYVNFMTDDEPDRIKAAYGASYERLVEVKKRVDPGNLFRMNQNISPNGAR